VRELGEHNWEAAAWDSLNFIHHQLGAHERAVGCYEQAIGLYRDLADQFNEADSLAHLGDVQLSAGDTGAARRTWSRALRIFDEIGHPDGGLVVARLHDAGRPLDSGRRAGPA
jgi:tetratricopeptide (TPR) repeat protein